MAKLDVPEGWCVQAFRFTLAPTEEQATNLARHFGARREAFNWTVDTLKADIDGWHAMGVETAKPSLRVLRKRWNAVKNDICVDADTGEVWWRECSKEAYADGIRGAVDAYWNWQTSRSGADRWFPSSKTCHACGHVQDLGWDEHWQCHGCSVTHQRDDNAAINLARYEDTDSVVGPVGAAVKRGADRKTGPSPAGGREARKGTSQSAGEQPRDGVRVA